MKPEVKVTQGEFRLASVHVVMATKDVLILEVDCHSKYPGGCSMAWSGDKGARVEIWSSDRSLYLDEGTAQFSSIELPGYTHDWVVLTDARKYSVRIGAYRRWGRDPRLLWSDGT